MHIKTKNQWSFSVSGNHSGVKHDATAFVGCSQNQVCCGCFGPAGGTDDYCNPDCTAKNGGTVKKDTYTWFWVRTSLPKRVWHRCMEYKVKNENGDMVSYKLMDGNTTPEKGHCPKDDVLLNEGIVVVPDSETEKKVPAIPGLLEYRKDNKELYVRSDKTWNVIAQESKILKKTSDMVSPKLQDIERKVYKQNQTILQEELEVDSKLKEVDQKLHKQNQTILQEALEVDSKLNDIDQKLSKQNQTMDLKFMEFEKKFANFILSNRQECNSYTLLDNQDRNIKYTGGNSAVCDSTFSTGWYRFGGDAGTRLPTTCVNRTDTSNQICRTHGVSWLNGTHPSVVDGNVTRTVCFSWRGNCCIVSTDIEVINCGFFYIYKLVSLSSWCHRRYCGTDV